MASSAKLHYRIDGDRIVQEFVREQFSMPVVDFQKALINTYANEVETPALPNDCRLFFRSGQNLYFIVEKRPGMFTLTHTLNREYDEDDDYVEETSTVSMPWQYFVGRFSPIEKPRNGINWQFHGLQLFWSVDRLNSIDSPVFVGYVPNIYRDAGGVCLGDTAPESTLEPADRMEQLVNNFYTPSSVFNSELEVVIPYFDMFRWETESQKNILWWRDYPDFGYTRALRNYLVTNGLNASHTSDPLNATMSTAGEALW